MGKARAHYSSPAASMRSLPLPTAELVAKCWSDRCSAQSNVVFVLRALACLSSQMSIFKILSAVLHLGNVEFKEKGDKLRITKPSEDHLEAVAALLA